jgi:putative heme iron utilization protein
MADKPEDSAFKLLSSRKTLVMATADKNGAPSVSYAPFVHHAPPLYVVHQFPFAPHEKYDGNGEGERHVHRR